MSGDGPHWSARHHLNCVFPVEFRCRNLRSVIFFDDSDAVAVQDAPVLSARFDLWTVAGRLAAGAGAAALMLVAVAAAAAGVTAALI
ncbi:hypothetical protein CLV67_12283 [Actinoplanes italicus]|uniref:Uncharacterized protein n=1 Tax=Actinoplanes italicus TaxID=113567 RepID=A0A2T0JZC3_9ACTN|nr:hypothetical protein CLV67_12283 [Actinoplanes italicus]